MASFTQNMRMNNLYPTQYSNAKLPSELELMRSNIDMNNMKMEQMRDEQWANPSQSNKTGGINPNLMNQIALNKPMDVKLGNQGNPAGTINAAEDRITKFENDGLTARESLAKQALAFKYSKQEEDHALKQQIANLKIPEAEKLELMNKFKIGQITAAGDQTRQTEGVRQTGRESLLNTRGEQQQNNINLTGNNNRLLEDTRQGNRVDLQSSGQVNNLASIAARNNKPLAPSQTHIQYRTNAEKLINSNPAFAPFIQLSPNGSFSVSPPGTNGLDEATYHQINSQIYGTPGPESRSYDKDIELKSDKTSPTKSTPIKTPTSKYKVTVLPGKK